MDRSRLMAVGGVAVLLLALVIGRATLFASTAHDSGDAQATRTDEPPIGARVVDEQGRTIAHESSLWSLTVSSASHNYAPDDGSVAPKGSTWVLLTASIANFSQHPTTISRESLTLIDQRGVRYSADWPNADTQPALVGADLRPSESLMGLVRFSVPAAATPLWLEWCADGQPQCAEPLRFAVPPAPGE